MGQKPSIEETIIDMRLKSRALVSAQRINWGANAQHLQGLASVFLSHTMGQILQRF